MICLVSYEKARVCRTSLLVALIAFIFLMQAGSAVLVRIETTISSSHAFLGERVTVRCYVYAPDYPGVKMAGVPIRVRVAKAHGGCENITGTTDASGRAEIPYTADEIGDYGMTAFATVNFSEIKGLPGAGVQIYPSPPPMIIALNDLNVTAGP